MNKSDSNVKIQILGNGDAFGSGGNFQTCFYVSGKDHHFLVDCGATALVAMKRYYVSPSLIDTIFLTHLHGDHFGGIPFFLLDAQYIQQRTHPLTIVGPEGTENKIFEALAIFYPGIAPQDFTYYIKFIEYDINNTLQIGPLNIEAFPVTHAEGSYPHGLRITFAKKVLAFSGDTCWNDTLYKIADQADIFICECNFYATPNNNHINYKELMEKIAGFTYKKIFLNHMSDEILGKTATIELPLTKEGQIIEV